MATGLIEQIGHVSAARIVVLPEQQTCRGGQPVDMLVSLAGGNHVGASAELTLKHMHLDSDVLTPLPVLRRRWLFDLLCL